jgi:peroxiredoxin
MEARMIKVGDKLPEATLYESTQFGEACPVSPNPISVSEAAQGKRVVIFALPGAYTPTCSAKHVPGYVKAIHELKEKKVDEVWCVSVNDGYVMAAWGKEQNALGKVRMLGDGSADFTKNVGLETDLTKYGMGVRSQRYSMLVDNGVVKSLNVEQPSKFEVSDAGTMLKVLNSI